MTAIPSCQPHILDSSIADAVKSNKIKMFTNFPGTHDMFTLSRVHSEDLS